MLFSNSSFINKNIIIKNKKNITRIKQSMKSTTKSFNNINYSLNNISKDLSHRKKLNRIQSECNYNHYKKLLKNIKKDKKYGKDYDVLGPLENNSIISLKKFKLKKEKLEKVWMNRTTANLLSFGEALQSLPDDLIYRERKRIIKDYLYYKNEAIPKYSKKKGISSKTLVINLKKIANNISIHRKK